MFGYLFCFETNENRQKSEFLREQTSKTNVITSYWRQPQRSRSLTQYFAADNLVTISIPKTRDKFVCCTRGNPTKKEKRNNSNIDSPTMLFTGNPLIEEVKIGDYQQDLRIRCHRSRSSQRRGRHRFTDYHLVVITLQNLEAYRVNISWWGESRSWLLFEVMNNGISITWFAGCGASHVVYHGKE